MLRAFCCERLCLALLFQAQALLLTAFSLPRELIAGRAQFGHRSTRALRLGCDFQVLSLKSADETGDGIWILTRGNLENYSVLVRLRKRRNPLGQHLFRWRRCLQVRTEFRGGAEQIRIDVEEFLQADEGR
jgi:hypothetical protein